MKTKIFKAFTLIELLIIVVIIGILASALIPRIQGMQDKARYARVEKDVQDFRAAVFLAQQNTQLPLRYITQTACTRCTCRNTNRNLRLLGANHNCRTNRISALRKIETAAEMDSGSLSKLETDPRGAPYILNENEDETQSTKCSASDVIGTVGPDGSVSGMNDSTIIGTTGDNRVYRIAPAFCPTAY